jgi:hypothetical protein
MRGNGTMRLMLTGSLAGLAACMGQGDPKEPALAPLPAASDYQGAEIEVLGDDLVAVRVALKGRHGETALGDYARCAAAGYAAKTGAGFLRHIRTKTDERGGIWHADAVYSVTSALPKGLVTIDAETTVADCADQGIPTAE